MPCSWFSDLPAPGVWVLVLSCTSVCCFSRLGLQRALILQVQSPKCLHEVNAGGHSGVRTDIAAT